LVGATVLSVSILWVVGIGLPFVVGFPMVEGVVGCRVPPIPASVICVVPLAEGLDEARG
jgi:hypothetical protein